MRRLPGGGSLTITVLIFSGGKSEHNADFPKITLPGDYFSHF